MSLSSAASSFRRVGPGQIFLAPAPTVSTGFTTEEGYYGLFYQTAANKVALLAAMAPWANIDNTGLDLKIKASTVKFDPNIGPAVEVVTGIESATAEITFFDVDPPHLVDIFGSQAGDLIAVAAGTGAAAPGTPITGVAARNIALLGPQSYNIPYCVLYRMQSMNTPGQFFHYLFPNVILTPDLDIKMSKKDEMKAKLTFQLMCSPFLMNSAGYGVVVVSDDPSVSTNT